MARKSESGELDIADLVPPGVNFPFIPPSGEISDYFDTVTGLGFDDFEGWCLLDGNNNTVDMAGRYFRGYGVDGEAAGVYLGYRTALPTETDFSISSDSHSHSYTDVYISSIKRSSDDDDNNSTAEYGENEDGRTIEAGANDTTGFKWKNLSGNSSSDSHSHSMSGGDDETCPNSIYVYYITIKG